eukprot:1158837-Pelagomonas_calceolata.AAC.2
MTRVYMWTIMRKLCDATYKAPLPTKEDHQKVEELAGPPEVTAASNEIIEMRTGREVVELPYGIESIFAHLNISNSRGSSAQVCLVVGLSTRDVTVCANVLAYTVEKFCLPSAAHISGNAEP